MSRVKSHPPPTPPNPNTIIPAISPQRHATVLASHPTRSGTRTNRISGGGGSSCRVPALQPSLPPLFLHLQHLALAIALSCLQVEVGADGGEGEGEEEELAVAADGAG